MEKEDIVKYSHPTYLNAIRIVENGRDPLIPSSRPSRATWTKTGGLYCCLDEQTCFLETKEHIKIPEKHLITSERPISVFDADHYCEEKGIPKNLFYAGTTSNTLSIHELRGLGAEAVMWTSQKSDGKSLALYVENIPDFKDVIKSERF